MAGARDWAVGYHAQAVADMQAARLVQGAEPSVLAMLLQMILEKLGKAALLRSGSIDSARAQKTHKAALTMVQVLARDRRACRRLNWKPDVVRYHLAPIVSDLERAQPALAAGGACLEYPWEDPNGDVRWPAEHLPRLRSFRPVQGGAGLMLFQFAGDLCARFDQVFP